MNYELITNEKFIIELEVLLDKYNASFKAHTKYNRLTGISIEFEDAANLDLAEYIDSKTEGMTA